jgi:hypothetical protein
VKTIYLKRKAKARICNKYCKKQIKDMVSKRRHCSKEKRRTRFYKLKNKKNQKRKMMVN